MAITDNTAKWQVKKLTNFTDKDREIATQAQAEEGVDNTKVMTPLRVKNAVDKQRPLKAYSRLEDLGLSRTTITYAEIHSNLPANSTLMFYTTVGSSPNLNLPKAGTITAYKTDNTTVTRFILQSNVTEGVYTGYYNGTTASFIGWKTLLHNGNIATQSEAEAGTDNATVMTPLRTAQEIDSKRPIKTFTSLDQLGLDDTANIEAICYALPLNSIFVTYISIAQRETLGAPSNGELIINKGYNGGTASIKLTSANTANHKMYVAVFNYGDNPKITWKQLATNGALSMPSGTKVNISATLDKLDYTAPADGWVASVFQQPIGVYAFYENYTKGGLLVAASPFSGAAGHKTIFVPVSKGDTFKIDRKGTTVVDYDRFYYAQSEV